MSRYESVDCPICGKPLEDGEEIVVCPVCGAPYHKNCYLEKGECIFTELHAKGENWEAPRTEPPAPDDNALRCPRCGTVNPPHGIFCQICGSKLNDRPVENGQPPQGFPPGTGMNPFPFPAQMPLNPYTTPFGGVAPDEEIDGIPAKDLAVFVGRNSHYFLPRFKALSSAKSKIVNWSAFFFQGWYFLYRKMFGPAVILFLTNILLAIPNALYVLQTSENGVMMNAAQSPDMSGLTIAYYVCGFLSIVLRFFCGLFANSIYKSHCERKITKERQTKRSEDEYYAVLAKKGNVALKLLTGLLIAYAVLYMFSLYAMIFLGMLG